MFGVFRVFLGMHRILDRWLQPAPPRLVSVVRSSAPIRRKLWVRKDGHLVDVTGKTVVIGKRPTPLESDRPEKYVCIPHGEGHPQVSHNQVTIVVGTESWLARDCSLNGCLIYQPGERVAPLGEIIGHVIEFPAQTTITFQNGALTFAIGFIEKDLGREDHQAGFTEGFELELRGPRSRSSMLAVEAVSPSAREEAPVQRQEGWIYPKSQEELPDVYPN